MQTSKMLRKPILFALIVVLCVVQPIQSYLNTPILHKQHLNRYCIQYSSLSQLFTGKKCVISPQSVSQLQMVNHNQFESTYNPMKWLRDLPLKIKSFMLNIFKLTRRTLVALAIAICLMFSTVGVVDAVGSSPGVADVHIVRQQQSKQTQSSSRRVAPSGKSTSRSVPFSSKTNNKNAKATSSSSSSSKATKGNNKKGVIEAPVVEAAPTTRKMKREQRRQRLTTIGCLMVLATTATTLILSPPTKGSNNKDNMISVPREVELGSWRSSSQWPKKRSPSTAADSNRRVRPAADQQPDFIPPRLSPVIRSAVYDRSATHAYRNDLEEMDDEDDSKKASVPEDIGNGNERTKRSSTIPNPAAFVALPSTTAKSVDALEETNVEGENSEDDMTQEEEADDSIAAVDNDDDSDDDLFDEDDDSSSSSLQVEDVEQSSFTATTTAPVTKPNRPVVAMAPDFATIISDEDNIFEEEEEEQRQMTAASSDPIQWPSPSPAVPVAVPVAAPSPKPIGFLGRIFGAKSGAAARPPDFKSALTASTSSNEEQLEMRQLLGLSLLRMLPDEGVARPFEAMLPREIRVMDQEEAEQAVLALGLEPATVAAAFADLTNALVVSLVDRAVNMDSGDGEQAVLALEQLSDFSEAAGGAYGRLVGNKASIEPIVYNGKSRANRLEALYSRYLKSCVNLEDIFGAMVPTPAAEGADQSSSEQKKEEKAQRQQLRQDRLGRLQFLFSIKENKRASIEQRVLKDLLSGPGGQNMENMMKSMLEGQGGGDQQAFADMLKDMEQGQRAGPGTAAGLPPGMENMSPEEMQEYSRQALASVKEQLEEGTMTLAEVLDFEKMLGQSCEDLVKGFEMARRDPRAKAAMAKGAGGTELDDLEWIFKQLAAIKKKGGGK